MEGLSTLALVLSLASTQAEAPAVRQSSWYITGFAGRSLAPLLGSEDKRDVWGFGIAHAQPERRFRIKRLNGELVLEGYYLRSSSPGIPGNTYIPPTKTDAVGLLAFARYRFPSNRGVGMFLDFGWGVQFADEPTSDLPSRINSTPNLSLGAFIRSGENEWLIAARFMHTSNAGFVGNNPGQNQLMLMLGYKF